ncbi:MAG: NYN domain-containing protein [Anaerolineae bacterium]|nr:NYN domain-containing protein [Promineifilum sp.]MCZ2115276.1 NYN domain-containing protein [Anaerolineae bacterium]
MSATYSNSRIGVYVDTANMYRNGGFRMRYDVLREFACRDGADPVRLNAYVSFDADRARTDSVYARNTQRFYSLLRDFGFKVVIKEVRWYEDENGKRYGKADADLDLAVDMLLQSENLDRVMLVTGDGDFARLVSAVQNRGCRVEVVSLDNASADLRRESDSFISGYLVPNLVPTASGASSSGDELDWGEIGSTVRGTCYFHKQDYGFGFMRFLRVAGPKLWLTDTQHPDSPYETAYFHDSNLPKNVDPQLLPSYNHVFQFELAESRHPSGKYEARNIQFLSWMPT